MDYESRPSGTVLVSETKQKDFQEQCLTARTLKKFLILLLTFWHKDPENPSAVVSHETFYSPCMRQEAGVSASAAHINIQLFVWEKKKKKKRGRLIRWKFECLTWAFHKQVLMFFNHVTVKWWLIACYIKQIDPVLGSDWLRSIMSAERVAKLAFSKY